MLALGHEPVEAEIRHLRDRHEVDAEVEGQHRENRVAVDRLAALVHRQHPVAVAVEGHPQVTPLAGDDLLERAQVGGAAADVDVRPVGLVADRDHFRAELLERLRRDRRVRAVRAVDGELQAGEIAAEALHDVADVARADHLEVVDAPFLLAAGRRLEQGLDLLLGRVRELPAVAVEELDAVVLRRVVRGGDDGAEIEREQRDGRRRQDACEHGMTARRRDAGGEGALELAARGTRVAPDEHGPAARPERCGATKALDELGREVLADDSPYAVGAEVASRHGLGRVTSLGPSEAVARRGATRAARQRQYPNFAV